MTDPGVLYVDCATCGADVDLALGHMVDQAGVHCQAHITVSLEIENAYELYEDVTTHVTDAVMPAPPAEVDSEEYETWSDDFIMPLTGVGEDHSEGDSWYDVTVTACSDPALVGRKFEFGY